MMQMKMKTIFVYAVPPQYEKIANVIYSIQIFKK